MSPRLYRVGMGMLLAAYVCGPVWAQAAQVQKVSAPPETTALAMTVGGRMQITDSPELHGFGSRAYESQWPGSYFEAAFKGRVLYFAVGQSHEILHIVVDGGAPLLLARPDAGVYELSGLGDGPHAVRVLVATESQAAPNKFGGFGIPGGETPLHPPARRRQIEFIGDSHTVGYGNTSTTRECTEDEVWARTDDTRAFGAVTANHYGADYQVIANSGHGVVRNYNGFAGDAVPVQYPYVLFDKKQKYSDPAWQPQVIVVALGTNDFSTPLNPGERWKTREELHADYEATYVRFVKCLRARNPRAYIVLWATEKADGEIESEVQKVAKELSALGEKNLAFLPVDGLQFSACDAHPSLADEAAISEKLVKLIDAHRQVWQGR